MQRRSSGNNNKNVTVNVFFSLAEHMVVRIISLSFIEVKKILEWYKKLDPTGKSHHSVFGCLSNTSQNEGTISAVDYFTK